MTKVQISIGLWGECPEITFNDDSAVDIHSGNARLLVIGQGYVLEDPSWKQAWCCQLMVTISRIHEIRVQTVAVPEMHTIWNRALPGVPLDNRLPEH